MKNYFGTLNSADDHLLREAISANNYDLDISEKPDKSDYMGYGQ